MTRSDKILCWVYAVIAVAALIATWTHNLAFFFQPNNGGAAGYIGGLYANPSAASFTNDILFYALAGGIFMVIEAGRLGIRHVWFYLVMSGIIAISVMFPLFLIARQAALARQRAQP